MTIYKCRNRRCRRRDQEFRAMDIADVAMATGRRVSCPACGQVAWFVRKEAPVPAEPAVDAAEGGA
jgi:hypothetical protein